MQRLSSGMRVNSAKDDAAGLAIAERMNTQVKGMNVDLLFSPLTRLILMATV